MSERTSVVVVGGGPCGLAAACELLQRGVSVRLLEAEPEPPTGSRAILLWPLALDVLRGLDVLAEAERRGLRVRALAYHLAGGRTLRSELGATTPTLLLPQQETGELLEQALQRLGGRVERGVRVTDVAVTDDGVTVKASGPDGAELIEADWLIGADGIASTVREQLGVEFPGGAIPVRYLAAEGKIDGDYERGAVHYHLGPAGPMVFAPLASGIVRLGGPVPDGTPLTPETVQTMLDQRGSGGLVASRVDMITTFGSQERIATALRRGRAFLVGDAAHTHSPVGGQGLNLGLQDVHNLAWKLAGVITGRYDPAILDSYEPERRHAAEQTVRNTGRFTKVFLLKPRAARVRNAAWRLLEAGGVLRRWFLPLLAGWRASYPESALAGEPPRSRGPVARLLPDAGSRRPAWVPDPAEPYTGFRLLTFGGSGGRLARQAAEIAGRLPAVVGHEHLRRRPAGFLLLRPDGYVAASGTTPAALERAEALVRGLLPA